MKPEKRPDESVPLIHQTDSSLVILRFNTPPLPNSPPSSPARFRGGGGASPNSLAPSVLLTWAREAAASPEAGKRQVFLVGGGGIGANDAPRGESHLAAVRGDGGEAWCRVAGPAAPPPPPPSVSSRLSGSCRPRPADSFLGVQFHSRPVGEWGGVGGGCCCIETIVNDAFDIVADGKTSYCFRTETM